MGDTQNTQILSQLDISSETPVSPRGDDGVWGRLYPIGSGFQKFDMKKEKVTCGRRADCDICLENVKTAYCNTQLYSSLHFTITKCFTAKSGHYTLITDTSSNGTFVNGERIGKGRQHALKNNSEISLCLKDNKAFVYCDCIGEDVNYPPLIRHKYTITKQLGNGAYGEVKLAFDKSTCQAYAIKIIQKKKFSIGGKQAMAITTEVEILKKISHPCIVRIHELIDTADSVYIVLDLIEGGELFDKIVEISRYPEPAAKFLFYQMVLAIRYLHEKGISHRDLKPENILLCSRKEVETLIKITDFGLSKFVDGAALMKTFCGTPNYLAPEVLRSNGDGKYTNKVDNWSLGVILYIMLSGFPPFADNNLDYQIRNGIYDFSDTEWRTVSDEAKDVVKQLMCVDVTKRASLNEILCHKWFTSEPNLLDRLQALIRKDHQDFDETILDCLKINESHEKTVTSEVAKRGLERTDSEASEERNGPRSSTLRQRRPVVEAKRQKKC